MRVSVIGGGRAAESTLDRAVSVGELLAERGHVIVCGGRGGVMEAACRGARDSGGTTIGILPGTDPADANPYVTMPIVTGIGDARNVLTAINGDGVIAIGGRFGTLSEIAHALNADRPVISLDSHDVDGIHSVDSPGEAVSRLEALATPQFD